MGQTDLSKQPRAPPVGLRTQRDLPRVSPAWRLRTRSCSHDNELYRMGLDRNADGEWEVVRNRVPQGLVDAMRAIVIRSERSATRSQSRSQSMMSQRSTPIRIKREPTELGMDVDMEAVDLEDGMEDVDNQVIDLTDSTAVFEEIRVYLDIDMEVEGGHVYIDEDGVEIQTVMTSVEATKMEYKAEVKMDFEDEMPYDHVRQLNGTQKSLASIVEEIEDGNQAIGKSADEGEQQPEGTDRSDETSRDPADRRRERKWANAELYATNAELHALLDATQDAAVVDDDLNTMLHSRIPTAISYEGDEPVSRKRKALRGNKLLVLSLAQQKRQRLLDRQSEDGPKASQRQDTIPDHSMQLMLVEQTHKESLLLGRTTRGTADDRGAKSNADAKEIIEPITKPVRRSIPTACGRCRKRKIRCSGQQDGGGPCSNCEKAGIENCGFNRVKAQELHFAEPINTESISIVRNPLAEPIRITPIQCGRCRERNLQCTGQVNGSVCQNCKDAGIDNCQLNRVQAQELHFAGPLNAFSSLGAPPMQRPPATFIFNPETQNYEFRPSGGYPMVSSISNNRAAYVSQDNTDYLPGYIGQHAHYPAMTSTDAIFPPPQFQHDPSSALPLIRYMWN